MDHTAGADLAPPARENPSLPDEYRSVRSYTERLAAELTDEDQCVQSMPDASPVKWHRAHTTWFYEEFLLRPHLPGYEPLDPTYRYLFNSYYEAVGSRHPRPRRGLLTRPSAGQVGLYRAHVDRAMNQILTEDCTAAVRTLAQLGLQHEQQHQELILTDMLHAFAAHPMPPAVLPDWREQATEPGPARMIDCAGGIVTIGHGGRGFAFDNETPEHEVLLAPYRIADRLVRNLAYLAFVRDGGYRTPTLWMSDGWAAVQTEGWTAPLYWREHDGEWFQIGPGGMAPLDPEAAVRHISWYEADAFARWAGARLPTEAEWEAASGHSELRERDGIAWQWTASAYAAYPGYRPAPGAIGEYNGKFMINQMVLRGGSVATPPGHTRPTYRNFFHPDRRWQFTGLRLAEDGDR